MWSGGEGRGVTWEGKWGELRRGGKGREGKWGELGREVEGSGD